MRILISILLFAHGFAHLIGFLTPWGLLTAGSRVSPPESSQTILGGRLVLNPIWARVAGVLWLALATAFGVVAIGIWRTASWSIAALVVVAGSSLALSLLWWPKARVGVYLNVAILLGVAALTYRDHSPDLALDQTGLPQVVTAPSSNSR